MPIIRQRQPMATVRQAGGAFNMDVSSDSASTASVKGGVTLQHQADLSGHAVNLKFKPYVGYQWEINEAGSAVGISGSSSSVVVNGQDIDTAQVGLAMEASYEVSERSSFKLGVDLSKDKNEQSGLAYVGYGFKF